VNTIHIKSEPCSHSPTPPYKDESLLESLNESFTTGQKRKATKRKSTVAQKPPSIEEIRAYFETLERPDLAEQFLDHHTAGGWRVGRNPMRDWKAAARTWKRNDEKWHGKKPNNSRRRAGSSPLPSATKGHDLDNLVEW